MKILFVHQKLMSFVEKDLEILRSAHEVREIQFRGMQDIPSLLEGTIWADITFSWFGKIHAFFAVLFSKMLGKKAVVVAGGDDVACEPHIKYGMFAYWWKKWCPLFVFRYANLILCVSEFNKQETINNARAEPEKIKMIYHGFSEVRFRRIKEISKENIVITIGRVSKETLLKKGIELFIHAASHLPNIKFVLIGPDIDGSLKELSKLAPENVALTGGKYGEELVALCNRAKVYVQVSTHESFGCSIAEAMLCECIPVVSNRAAILEVVGDCGFYIKDMSPKSVAEQIKEALLTPDDLGKKARERIKTLFPLEQRKCELLNAIESVCNGSLNK
ncbi:GDP-mannose:cellobiosyl-diphosphopolyprenol alpha-mannosyltransferase [Candidatus Brocadiaceae bacterium B188]|nr:glycosyltransferase family 4 protein [Candidatus Brocadia sapporoensis]TWU49891.1 GDP-mannose:cellobiosyl-diphosphopolyprenol alpha-mannosyltransferase [Candidatus Brocadiaceae bacterium B188]